MSEDTQMNSDEENNENFKLFVDERKVLIGLMSSNNMELSKSIITLSTFSLGYVLYQTGNINDKRFLIYAGLCFSLTILSVIASFILGSASINKQIEINRKFYLKGKDDAFEDIPWQEKAVKWIFYFTCIFFILGLILVFLSYIFIEQKEIING